MPNRLYEDPNTYELYFECPDCELGYGDFSMRITLKEHTELNPNCEITFKCPRKGHSQNWNSLRGSCRVDSHGYTIDRNHPLWRTE